MLMPIAVAVIAGGTLLAVLTTRVLDAKHIISLSLERISLVATVGVFVWGIDQLALQFVPAPAAFVLALAFGLWLAAAIYPWLQQIFSQQARSERVRKQAFAIAREELRPETMEAGFLKALQKWAGCERAAILMGAHGRLTGDGLEFAVNSPEMQTLAALRWVTPERLERERATPERRALGALLAKHNLGVMVASVGPSPALVVGLGVPLSQRPYTYPEIGVLLQLAAIFENSLSRAHYLMKAQHSERLATVGLLGASIAHEIRNPLVSIKTFVQLLPNHYQDPVFREKFFRLIGEEVGRIDRMTEQLLDLSAPRVFAAKAINLHPVLRACIDLMAAKAEDKGVGLVMEFNPENDVVFTDPNAIKQVMLNLGFNAIQALERHHGDRLVYFKTTKVVDGIEVIVEDSGPGFTPELHARLFQPFQSTKSSGFGLGLAICKDILSSLQASITADLPLPGQGARFRVVLPCPPAPSS
jgi:signal transduction histidine kinase